MHALWIFDPNVENKENMNSSFVDLSLPLLFTYYVRNNFIFEGTFFLQVLNVLLLMCIQLILSPQRIFYYFCMAHHSFEVV